MDAVVKPIGTAGTEWLLQDQFGCPLGRLRKTTVPVDPFTILPERGSPLDGVYVFHPTLDAALTAIGRCLGGTCELVEYPEP
ncbi:hypothetical protein [Methylobacterium oxalidis]|uniref:Uncharacterized protein n=1 Tax=Methylobacterium oxalidis TaxID=944322 RepID=A0A512JCK3_9HYPH|nr:hypothetical protein [Methylobacterium oxalidis]GEP07676.1 hypothetical protein MOX02_57140 [Methylobacterium oxalidis]GJE35424.1 hypothetical protein LDDCCGHA_5642 [Methylobacterium oxalidis]GLS64566.1 hypothetical protein GCM10007888_29470 [Methylobacterium oxalidis]